MTPIQSAARAEHFRNSVDPWLADRDMDHLADTAHRMGVIPDPATWMLIREIRGAGLSVNSTDLTMCPGSYAARLPGEQHCRVCGQRVVRSDWTAAQTPGGFVGRHDPSKESNR